MKKALKNIGLVAGAIALFTLGGLGGYELAWVELFTRKHYCAADTLETAARDTWRKPFVDMFHCGISYMKNRN